MVESFTRTEQLALAKGRARAAAPPRTDVAAPNVPVARIAVDIPLAHLDRLFDYVVPLNLHESVVPGCRVKVRFAGRDVDGFVVERAEESGHLGALAPLRRVVSSEAVLHPQVLAVARMVADRYAGSLGDVLRMAVPPRHARVEAEGPGGEATQEPTKPAPLHPASLGLSWTREVGGEALLERLANGGSPRAVWTALPGIEWASQLAEAVVATAASGRGSVVCLPDIRDVERVGAALEALVGRDGFVVLTSELGPAARYRAFLAVARGQVRIVLGNRAAAFAPVRKLGLVAIWDDGDDLHAEQRAPYHHTREVLLLRAHHERCAALLGGFGCSVEARSLIESGWAAHVSAAREQVRRAAPLVHVTGDTDAELARDFAATATRMPRRVFEVVREALRAGPVLVHSPRYGYLPALTCERCRQAARCAACSGPLSRPSESVWPGCRWCGAVAEQWSCPHCQGRVLRAPVVGSLRTGQEWGRSFSSVRVHNSGGDHVLSDVDDDPAIVIATPGAEPVAQGGYAAAVLLDTWLTLSRPGLRVDEEALRRWLNVAALVRPGSEGGRVIAVGEPTSPTLQALVRWDPAGFASRGLDERRSAHLPPVSRLATLTASPDVLTEALVSLELPKLTEVLGPVEVADGEARVVLRIPRERGAGLTKALQQLQAGRSSRKLASVRVQVDPLELT